MKTINSGIATRASLAAFAVAACLGLQGCETVEEVLAVTTETLESVIQVGEALVAGTIPRQDMLAQASLATGVATGSLSIVESTVAYYSETSEIGYQVQDAGGALWSCYYTVNDDGSPANGAVCDPAAAQ